MNLSNRERSIWGHMVFETGLTGFYLWQVLQMPADTLLNSDMWIDMVVGLIPVAIIGGIIIGAIVMKTKVKTSVADERDRGIEAKADGIAYRVMIVTIALYGGLLGFCHGILPDLVPQIWSMPKFIMQITPFTVLNTLIVIMLIAETSKYISQLLFYRRGY